ncbi:trans-sulfuration enzyme family protein [Oscillibacter valericigenes]|uniref:trans-sulfuration enzyme family protein n=1 Tax=Oscillibacter valericigenes TaxID=351091 RepID=UPI00195DA610|nr:PLP-dependent aspartate aminotransferase family protein [Oscillibacter valericigenes]MBM6909322.1 PLP-dependent transferase [Oscillibacter valericigenes]
MSKIDLKNVDFETLIIHAGQEPDKAYGSLATPIYQTSTFCFETVEEGAAKFANQIPGFVYSRGGNPTTRAFELKCAAMEGGEDAVAAASGMGAVGSVMTAFLHPGDHAIFDTAVYGGTNYVATTNLPGMGVEVSRVDTGDLEAVKAAIRPNTKMIYFETPNNPMMKVTDVRAIKDIAGADIRVVVDGTFAPPPVQHVLQLGADIVLHSITKYINGHGDALGGVVIGRADDIRLIRANSVTKINGCPPSPFNSYLVLRGMKTLALRMKQHCASAMEIARYLEANPYVKAVYYPGLESHPQHELASRQMENGMYGGMISFELKDDVKGLSSFEAGKKLLNSLKIPAIAVSLGDPDSLIEHPASMTHANVSPEDRLAAGITDGLIRLSVGLESAKDLIADFEQAFAAI